jgi:hypothetical protein
MRVLLCDSVRMNATLRIQPSHVLPSLSDNKHLPHIIKMTVFISPKTIAILLTPQLNNSSLHALEVFALKKGHFKITASNHILEHFSRFQLEEHDATKEIDRLSNSK